MLKRHLVSLIIALSAAAGLPLHSQTPVDGQKKAPTATVKINDAEASAGRNVAIEIELESASEIGAIIFTLNWDPTAFTYVSSALTAAAPKSANLSLNTQPQHNSAGRLGVLMDTTAAFEKGKKTVMTATFEVLASAAPRDYQFTFGSTPAMMSLSTINAQLVDTKFIPGTVRVASPRRSVSGRVLSELRFGINRAQITLTGAYGKPRTVKTNSFGYFNFDDLPEGTYTVNAKEKRYSFAAQSVQASTTPNEIEFQFAT